MNGQSAAMDKHQLVGSNSAGNVNINSGHFSRRPRNPHRALWGSAVNCNRAVTMVRRASVHHAVPAEPIHVAPAGILGVYGVSITGGGALSGDSLPWIKSGGKSKNLLWLQHRTSSKDFARSVKAFVRNKKNNSVSGVSTSKD